MSGTVGFARIFGGGRDSKTFDLVRGKEHRMARKENPGRRAGLGSGIFLASVFLASFLWVLGSSPAAVAADEMLLRSYGSVRVGAYEGVLYCLRHDFSEDKKDREICPKEGAHLHVLVMDDGHVHPLYGRTKEMNELINASDINAKRVRIQGKYFPLSNAILVGSMEELATE
jgi:hypothetical protein